MAALENQYKLPDWNTALCDYKIYTLFYCVVRYRMIKPPGPSCCPYYQKEKCRGKRIMFKKMQGLVSNLRICVLNHTVLWLYFSAMLDIHIFLSSQSNYQLWESWMVLMVFDNLLNSAIPHLPCGKFCHLETKWPLM